jgi:hypothetical protein
MVISRNVLALLLVIVAGGLFLSPYLFHQQDLAQGDHGRDLYSVQAVLRGEVPYRDFWWVYGPLMPYYYAVFYKFGGANVASILLGKAILNIISGVFIYLSLSLFITPLLALIGAFWFWAYFPDFYFTYNHAGGITLLFAIAYTLLLYIKKLKTAYLLWGLAGIFLLSLVKINFGFSALISYLLSVRWIDKLYGVTAAPDKQRFYAGGIKIMPVLILGIYLLLVWGMPVYEIRQCFPFLPGDHPQGTPFEKWLKLWPGTLLPEAKDAWPHKFLAVLIVSALISLVYFFKKSKIEPGERRLILTTGKVLALLYLFHLHEYMGGAVTPYRLYWAQPFSLLLSFLLIGTVLRYSWPAVQWLIIGILLFGMLGHFKEKIKETTSPGFLSQLWTHPRGGIIVKSAGEGWINTANKTSAYLQKHLADDETFFALPYDPLYYYLADKKSPTRQLIFFDHINIPPEQEKDIIADLERRRINYIVLSNRMKSRYEEGMGTLGETYCPLIGKYIEDHFETLETYGEWEQEPLWAWRHGIKILKRVR